MSYAEPAYEGEIEKVNEWAEKILDRSIPESNLYLKRGRCECPQLFCFHAPDVIIET